MIQPCQFDVIAPNTASTTLNDMEDELLVGPSNFSSNTSSIASQSTPDFALLQDDFLDLADDTHQAEMALCQPDSSSLKGAENHLLGIGGHSNQVLDNPVMKLENLDNWDQDVLLSNAGLPETNPLLLDDDLDPSMGEDFQKMLNDWENHIGSLHGSDMPDVDISNLVSSEVPPTSNATSMPGGQSSVNVIKTEKFDHDESSEMEVDMKKPVQQLATIRDEGQTKMTLGQMALAGIVISSGPGDYFETYEVLEASDADNLLEQFEEVPSDFDEENHHNQSNNGNPRKTSNIFKAVQNHFAASAACNDSNSRGGCKRLPRIVPSQRIKDALPREIIERIKASSQKSRTIAIIEPVHHSTPSNGLKPGSSSVNKSENIHGSKSNLAANSSNSKMPTILSKSHVIQPQHGQPQQHHTRFAEAATSLNKSKHLRLISQAATSNPKQVQISLDHDYCSSSSKVNKRASAQPHRQHHQIISSSGSRPVIRLQPQTTVVTCKPSSIVVSSPMTTKSVIRVNPDNVITMPIAVEVTSTATSASSSYVMMAASGGSAMANSVGNSAQSPLSSPARKDSGLESGEASDTSESQHAVTVSSSSAASNNSDLYDKVPDYLTAVSVNNNDSRSIGTEEDNAYDRLPAYVKGVPKRSSSNRTNSPDTVIIRNPNVVTSTPSATSTTSSTPGARSMRTRQMRSRSSSSNSSGCDNNEVKPVIMDVAPGSRMTTRSRTSTLAVPAGSGSTRRRRQSSSSSSSSSTDARASQRNLKKRRTWRKPQVSSSDRSRSPADLTNRRRFQTSSKQQRPVEERRVVYVGRISEGTTRADLRKRFEVFGIIEEISVHFRDRGDNYGFVTFRNKKDAFSAIERGNDDTSQPRVDLCFGGRRAFCKEKYADLDSGMSGSRSRYVSKGPIKPAIQDNDDDVEDFDALLKQVRSEIRK